MKKIIVGLIAGALAQFVNAAVVEIPVTNSIEGTLDKSVVGYQYSQPVICVKTAQGSAGVLPIKGGETVTLAGEEMYYYDSDVRLNGCDANFDPYLGYMGIEAGKVTFSPLVGTLNRMKLENVSKSSASPSITGKLSYVPIPVNLDPSGQLKPINKNRKLTYIGINLSGAEFGKTISPNSMPDLSRADQNEGNKPGPDLASMNDGSGGGFVPAGINVVRVPISWGYLELLKAPSTIAKPEWVWNSGYWDNFIAPTLATLTNAGMYTVLDLHTYLHYSAFGSEVAGCFPGVQKCPDGTKDINPDHYVKVWSDILQAVRASGSKIDEKYLMFDLINEPAANQVSGTPYEVVSPQDAFNVQVPVAKALQANNFQGKILLEGASWTGLHSWESPVDGYDSNAIVFTKANLMNAGVKFNEHSNNVLINVHQYFDDDFSGTQDVCLPNLQSKGGKGTSFNTGAFATWLKKQELKAVVTEFGTSINDVGGFCQPILASFVNYLTANAVKEDEPGGGFIGATLWATGHDWGNYNLLYGPKTYQFTTFMDSTIEK